MLLLLLLVMDHTSSSETLKAANHLGILFAYFKIVPFRMHSEHKRTLFLIGFVCANISHFVLGYAEFIFKRIREITV